MKWFLIIARYHFLKANSYKNWFIMLLLPKFPSNTIQLIRKTPTIMTHCQISVWSSSVYTPRSISNKLFFWHNERKKHFFAVLLCDHINCHYFNADFHLLSAWNFRSSYLCVRAKKNIVRDGIMYFSHEFTGICEIHTYSHFVELK